MGDHLITTSHSAQLNWRGWEKLSPVLHLANFYDAGERGGFGPRYVQEFQILFVQSGRGKMQVDGKRFEIRGGDAIFYGPRQRHQCWTSDDEPLQLIGLAFLFSEADRARCDRSLGHARPKIFPYPDGEPRCPLDPRPPTKVSCGAMSLVRRHCESLVLSYVPDENGRQLEKRGLLLLLFEALHEVIVAKVGGSNSQLPEHHRRMIDDAQRAMTRDLRDPPSPAELAQVNRISEDHFARLFKRHTGSSATAFVEQQRLLAARRLLVERRMSVKEIAHAVGFDDPFYFTRRFTKQFGVAPTALREARGVI